MKKVLFGITLLLSFLFLFGCTDSDITIPYTTSQFVARSTDLNYTSFVNGDYNGLFLSFDGNVLTASSVPDFNISGADINWSQLINFPSGCADNQAVKIVGSSLVCVDLPIDTNFETYGFTADDINNALIVQTVDTNFETAGYDFGDYVPFTGADDDVNLGLNNLTAQQIIGISDGDKFAFYEDDVAQTKAFFKLTNGTGAASVFNPLLWAKTTSISAPGMWFIGDSDSSTGSSVPLLDFSGRQRGNTVTNRPIVQFSNLSYNGGIFQILINGIWLMVDNYKLWFGEGKDASISYDGTDLIINPKEVGSGILNIQGDLNIDETIQAQDYYSGDGTQGYTGTCASGTTLTVKDGLVTGCA